MANSDNPIFQVVDEVLGIKGRPMSFSDRIDRLVAMVEVHGGQPQGIRDPFVYLKYDKGLSSLGGSIKATSQIDIGNLYSKLVKSGLLPEEAESLFEGVKRAGGSFFFNEGAQQLYYGTANKVVPLPLRGPGSTVLYGGGLRKVNRLLFEDVEMDFASAFYQARAGHSLLATNPSGIFSSLNETLKFKLGSGVSMSSLLLGSPGSRGRLFPEAGMFSANMIVPIQSPPQTELGGTWRRGRAAEPLFDILKSKRLAEAAYAGLVKTGGRYISQDLKNAMPGISSYGDAFAAIERLEGQYREGLVDFLNRQGALASYPFIKPEYLLGQKGKFAYASPAFAGAYGTLFEEHTLKKGLFQLANIAATTPEQIQRISGMGMDPFAPFITKAQLADPFAATRTMGLRVGVIDFANQSISRSIVQEGGAFLTPQGLHKLATTLPIGTVNIGGASEGVIAAAENLFGVSLGEGNLLRPGTGLGFSRFDYSQAVSKLPIEKLTDIQRNLRTLVEADPRYRGMWRAVTEQGGRLGQIQLTDVGGLRLDFLSAGPTVAPSMEMIMGSRRFTGVVPGQGSPIMDLMTEHHPLRGTVPVKALQGVDVFIGADEFNKMFGPRVLLENFITEVSQRQNAGKIFRQAFGEDISFHMAPTEKGIVHQIPIITDHDTAYRHAIHTLNQWQGENATKSQRVLAEKILHGTRVSTDHLLNQGIKGVSIFTIGGGLRLDFMGDINMMKPVRMTASKMTMMATGARLMGYEHAYRDPLFKLLTQQSTAWRDRHIGVRAASGELFLSKAHQGRMFAEGLLGRAAPGAENIITLGKGGFYHKGQLLNRLPADPSLFGHATGGIPLEQLRGTILDPKVAGNLLYLDIGEERALNLVGSAKDTPLKYRYLPLNLQYMRTAQGIRGNLVIGKTHPTYPMLKALTEIQNVASNNLTVDPIKANERLLSEGYQSILRALPGREGLFNLTSTIRVPSGTRARLVPSVTGYHSPETFMDANRMYDAVVSRSQFEDYLTRKSGIDPKQVNRLRELARTNQDLYAMIGVDPMQRAEHAQVFRIKISDTAPRGARVGQLNLELHDAVLRMFERDVDRDVANVIFLDGLYRGKMGTESAVRQQLENRILTQQKLSRHFLWFHKMEQSKLVESSEGRFGKLLSGEGIVSKIEDFLGVYLGTPKSLGYTITRASDTIMNNIIGYGMQGAKRLGIAGVVGMEDMVTQIRAPYLADPVRYGVSQRLMQNLYQGAVQKGVESKQSLRIFAQELVGIGQTYKGTNFNYEKIVDETEAAVLRFLEQPGMKDRGLMAMSYAVESGMLEKAGLTKETTERLMADLQRGLTQSLDDASIKHINKAYARLIAENLGPGMTLAASVRRGPRSVASVIQTTINEGDSLVKKVLSPMAGEYVPRVGGVGSRAGGTILDKVADAAAQPGMFERMGKFFSTDMGHFALGLGIGGLAGAALASFASGPEAPMPREVDSRQPMDVGPQIYNAAPRLYGSNTVAHASRNRRPETFSPIGSYNFGVQNDSSVVLRDKTSPNNPYLLEQQLKQIANSDYTY